MFYGAKQQTFLLSFVVVILTIRNVVGFLSLANNINIKSPPPWLLYAANKNKQQDETTATATTWRLALAPETSNTFDRMVADMECKMAGSADVIHIPKQALTKQGALVVLQVFDSTTANKQQQMPIAKFGISLQSGPPNPNVQDAVEQVFAHDKNNNHHDHHDVRVAAIVYMFVEESHRKQGIGRMALRYIEALHAIQDIQYTLLVADDDGSGKLIAWYERYGFSCTPSLQEMVGSPKGEYGTAMMTPVSISKEDAYEWLKQNPLQCY
mmetsp:Transcript_33639/g.51585  ORF Transcript_33639/g.51585 Transcript_33639/m.51585 type:complete len:268 (-) Transcript_33639:88-891(-)